MNRKTKQIATVLALVAMISFGAWPFWKYMYIQAADAALQERTRALVEENPNLTLAWVIAMQDDVLTESEATAIVTEADEESNPER